MTDSSARFGLPYLLAGQGQKDVTHNEAITMLDFLVQPTVKSRVYATPPIDPSVGEAWLVDSIATGPWFGMEGRIAAYTAGGWRFLSVAEGMQLWVEDELKAIRFTGADWIVIPPFGAPAAAVDLPVGGAVVDQEARASIVAILERLNAIGLVH
jgi:hypothetical protein